MQLANLTPSAWSLEVAVVRLGWPVDPQPLIAAPARTAITIKRGLTREMRTVLMAPVVRQRR